MRCVVALVQHETNTFSPLPTPLSAFAGDEMTKPAYCTGIPVQYAG